MRIIINADDCGRNEAINNHIEKALKERRISSTTVMANMEDLEGASRLYNQYHDIASFGFHINLTQGCPIIPSEVLLECGFYKMVDGRIEFNAQPFRRKFLNIEIREDIYREVLAQYNRIVDSGIVISHIDGHHFIHQAFFMVPLLPRLCKEIGVYKIRNYRNYIPNSFSRILRNFWSLSLGIQMRELRFTDFFDSYESFYNYYKKGVYLFSDSDIIELMCHPGGKYKNEETLIMNNDSEEIFNCKLVTYNEI